MWKLTIGIMAFLLLGVVAFVLMVHNDGTVETKDPCSVGDCSFEQY